MTPLLADHMWQSTLFGAAAALVAFALRRRRAEVRFWIWFAASAKFLVPFAALAAVGAAAGFRWVERRAEIAVPIVVDAVSQPFSQPSASALPARAIETVPDALGPALAVVWLCGSLAVMAFWCTRWRRVRAIASAGVAMAAGRELDILRRLKGDLPLVVCDGPLEPGLFGIIRPVVLWPRAVSARLNDDQIAAILRHELAHADRRDNLTAALHMAVQALFWFHPLVWWIGRRLLHERERACDDAALRSGGEPAIYAESILKTCEWSVECPLVCVSGVTGADLKGRIEAIMSHRSAAALNPWGKLALITAAVAVLVAPVLVGAVSAPPRQAASPVGERLMFDVASIKPNASGAGRVSMRMLPGGAYEAVNVTMRAMIQQAFRMSERQVIGGPSWLETDRFDLLAKSPQGALPSQFADRLRSLLVDRLQLVTHRETREMPIYALVLARRDGSLGPQIRSSPVDCSPDAAAARGRAGGPPAAVAGAGGRQQMPMPAMPPLGSEPRPCGMMIGPNGLTGGGATMASLANMLQNNTGRIVQDRTGLTGSFDFDLTFTPDPGLRGRGPGGGLPGQADQPGPAPDPDAVSIFTALQEQLGLRLASATGDVEVLVIDRAERPTEN